MESTAKSAAQLVVTGLFERLRSPEEVSTLVENSGTVWAPTSLARGWTGIGLACGHMDRCFPDEGWDSLAYVYLKEAVSSLADIETPPLGLLTGLSGIAFTARYCSHGGTRYKRLLTSIDQRIEADTLALCEFVSGLSGMSTAAFDAVSGLAGIGAYLLSRKDSSSNDHSLDLVLSTLQDLILHAGSLPRWHTPAQLIASEVMRSNFASGNLNLGMAHGLAGIVAFLGLATTFGLATAGSIDALRTASQWMVANSFIDEFGPDWPPAVSLDADTNTHRTGNHASWCYGSPGIARSLWIAGIALDDTQLREFAVDAIRAALSRPDFKKGLPSGTFCHGWAGLLQVTQRFWLDTRCLTFVRWQASIIEALLNRSSNDHPLLFADVQFDGQSVFHPGLLDGATGAALVLLGQFTHVDPSWDRVFLLS
jgi:lantibiotic biosynthesis protein